MLKIEKADSLTKKAVSLAISVGMLAASTAGLSIFGNNDNNLQCSIDDQLSDFSDSSQTELDNQIEENKNKLQALESSEKEKKVDYSRLGC